MRLQLKKHKDDRKLEDDSLFGLLSSYKSNVTYFKILISEDDNKIAVQITDNPKKWALIPEDRYTHYKELRRLEIETTRLSVKYLAPKHLIQYYGTILGMKLVSKDLLIF